MIFLKNELAWLKKRVAQTQEKYYGYYSIFFLQAT